MKKILLPIAIFLMTASSKTSEAQSNKDLALLQHGITSTMSGNLKESSEAKVTEVNVKAMRDFLRTYKKSADAKWFRSENGFFASFDKNGTNTKVVYDSKGLRSYIIISYSETKLDRNIRTLVKSTYFDAAIIGVHQFEFDNITVHVIKMIDQQSRPFTLKVTDGRIEDITSHGKK